MTNTTNWVLDPSHSEVIFKVKHLMITNVQGSFKKFGASISSADNTFKGAEVSFHLDTESVDTNDANRDGHLKSPDFFDSENHKQITFTTTIDRELQAGDTFDIDGHLTIKGLSHPVKLNVEFGGFEKDPWGNDKVGFSISSKISREKWGLVWNAPLASGGLLVSDEVRIACEVQFVKQA